MDYSHPGSSVHGIFQARNTGVGCHFLLQGIFLSQGLNPLLLSLLHWQEDFYHQATWETILDFDILSNILSLFSSFVSYLYVKLDILSLDPFFRSFSFLQLCLTFYLLFLLIYYLFIIAYLVYP